MELAKDNQVGRIHKGIWYAREYWNGDSRDGQYMNGDGYHYFELQPDGTVLRAYEYYETDDGDERVSELPELIGIRWYEFFGFSEEDELLEPVSEFDFHMISELVRLEK